MEEEGEGGYRGGVEEEGIGRERREKEGMGVGEEGIGGGRV